MRAIAILASLLPCLASCAQVTGLSDDYRYDLVDKSSMDGATSDAGNRGDGGVAAEAGGSCSTDDRARAATSINGANGSTLPPGCTSCLADDCCGDINACAASDACNKSMQCVFSCQRQGNKQDCVARCDDTFLRSVGSCLQTSCTTFCQLQ